MKCPNCGAEIGNNRVCDYCDTPIPAEMLKEQELRNKQGCPNCGSTNITFEREKHGEIEGKNSKQVILKTVGLCKDCGHTWVSSPETPPKRKTWLWVLGWIFIFPVPLTILMLRKKDMKPVIKYGIIAIAWLVYVAIGMGGNSSDNNTSSRTSTETQITDKSNTTTEVDNEEKNIQDEAKKETDEKNTKAEESTSLDWSVFHDDDEHRATYVTVVQSSVDKYVSGVKWPWSFDNYVCANYDDKKDGCIVCSMQSVEIKNIVEKQNIIVIFTIMEDGKQYKTNSVAVGDKVYYDDGKLQNLLDKLNGN